ncbi:Molybdopterin synthase sulfur carrier subunit [Dyadobacter sp. CECT 9275]|uniref:Molybdopterin synthase sulfur carrier subunit n=1 Tax=Dyadobacter helix TaxID=2822344 RepID=A0A916N710_9BACT|nr:MoaD/ThiS family protein [Dyadobacter sp. CECT 9275]CAG5006371.1 Molybdopterin synthase sulfur carrier subunit [Dyadobacter sp. CECT 9275]
MNIRILYFGAIADITGVTNEQIDWPEGGKVADLRREMEGKYPELHGKKFKIAVNHQISDDNILISSPSEIAFLPPFAGG